MARLRDAVFSQQCATRHSIIRGELSALLERTALTRVAIHTVGCASQPRSAATAIMEQAADLRRVPDSEVRRITLRICWDHAASVPAVNTALAAHAS
jgi:hypothetical protein